MAPRPARIARLASLGIVLLVVFATAACAPFPLKQQSTRLRTEAPSEASESKPAESAAPVAEGGGVGGEIYRTGMTPVGPVAFKGGDATAVAACARCHGMDGKGGTAPAVTGAVLAKAGYKDDTIARAISQGIDQKNKPLDKAMPRYSLPKEQLASVIAYLKLLK